MSPAFPAHILLPRPPVDPDPRALLRWAETFTTQLGHAWREMIYVLDALSTVDTLANRSSTPALDHTFFTSSDTKETFVGVNGVWQPITLGILNVKAFGATGDGVTDDTAAIQAAIAAAEVIGTATRTGQTVFFPPGTYAIGAPLVLPRTGSTPTGVVQLLGANIRSTRIVGLTGTFAAGDALIEWEVTAARAWHQRIGVLTLIPPSVTGTMAIRYSATDTSTAAALRAERLQIHLHDLLIESSNEFHPRAIFLECNVMASDIERVYHDPSLGGAVNFETMTLETLTTPIGTPGSEAEDAAGFINSRLVHLVGGLRRGGRAPLIKGRFVNSSLRDCIAGIAGIAVPTCEFVNSYNLGVTDLYIEGTGAKPQIRVDTCAGIVIESVHIGAPVDAGSGFGNAVEVVATRDSIFRNVVRKAGTASFSANGVKMLTIDAASVRNRFENWVLRASVANEITNSAPDSNDNYGEFYDAVGAAWGFIGRRQGGPQVITALTVDGATAGLRNGWETTTAATDTLTTAESGKVFYCTLGSGTQVFTLPATVAGVTYTFVCGHADGEINLSPAAADKITGKGIAGADDQDVKNTGATNAVGDTITVVGDGVDGWVVTQMLGTHEVV